MSQDPPPALLQPLTNALIFLHYMTIALRGHIEKSNQKNAPKVSQSSPRPQESPTLAQSLRSLHTFSLTSKVPLRAQVHRESLMLSRTRIKSHARIMSVRDFAKTKAKSPPLSPKALGVSTPSPRPQEHHSRPRQIRGCAVVSLTHVYKPLIGLYACGRANRKKA